MSGSVYVAVRVLGSHGGSGLVVPVKAFDTEGSAIQAANDRAAAIDRLLNGQIFVEQEGQWGPAGMLVRQLMADLGISSIRHGVQKLDVHGADLVSTSSPKIILPH